MSEPMLPFDDEEPTVRLKRTLPSPSDGRLKPDTTEVRPTVR